MDGNATVSLFRQQYDNLPYPPRNPADESKRLVRTVGDDLTELNHHCFRAGQTFQDHFRCLVAGGGTGDAAIFLAEQLRDSNAEIVYVDTSEAARRIAQQRAQARGLKNIRWVTASLLDVPRLDLGMFDYINCAGALHHLPDPKEELQSLASVLRDDGALFLMLYARYGRRGVHELQEALRALLPHSLTAQDRIKEARSLIGQLPSTNHFQRNRELWEGEIDAAGYGDAGFYELLLHSQDRAYDVDAIYDLLQSAALQFLGFTGPQKRSYQLTRVLRNPSTLRLCENLSPRQSSSVAEKLSGNIVRHSFYAARNADRSARLEDYVDNPNLCIVLTAEMKDRHEQVHEAIVPGETLCITYAVRGREEVFQLPGNAINKALFRHFDGATPIEKMIAKVKTATGSGNSKAILAEIEKAFELMHGMGWAYLSCVPVSKKQ
jgi:SAM-dependent methyltransferase